MKNIIYDHLLKMYVGNEELRPALQSPITIGNYIYATDAHHMIRFKKNLCKHTYESQEKAPACDVIFKEFKTDVYKEIKVESILEKLTDCRFEYETEMCDTCEGSGEVECKCCGHDGECANCKGTGYEESDNPFSMQYIEGGDVYFEDKLVNPRFLNTLITVAAFLKQDTIQVKYNSKVYGKLLFEVGEASIIIMCKLKDN